MQCSLGSVLWFSRCFDCIFFLASVENLMIVWSLMSRLWWDQSCQSCHSCAILVRISSDSPPVSELPWVAVMRNRMVGEGDGDSQEHIECDVVLEEAGPHNSHRLSHTHSDGKTYRGEHWIEATLERQFRNMGLKEQTVPEYRSMGWILGLG